MLKETFIYQADGITGSGENQIDENECFTYIIVYIRQWSFHCYDIHNRNNGATV